MTMQKIFRIICIAILSTGLLCSPSIAGEKEKMAKLFAELEELSGGTLILAASDEKQGFNIGYNADLYTPMASTYKIAIAATLLSKVEDGTITLNQMINIPFSDIVMGGSIQQKIIHEGLSLSVINLLELMIVESDNTVTDALFNLIGGPSAVQKWLNANAIKEINVSRKTQQILKDYYSVDRVNFAPNDPVLQTIDIYGRNKDFESDPRDQATAAAMLNLLQKLDNGNILKQKSEQLLWEIMTRARTGKDRICKLLPKNAVISCKAGTVGASTSDVARIVTPDGKTLYMAIYVKGSEKPLAAREEAIAKAAKAIYDYYEKAAKP